MSEVYRHFSKDWTGLNYSEQSLLELYISESHGGLCNPLNGFYIGKKYLNLTVNMWKEDIQKGLLFKKELYEDSELPNWWLDKVFKCTIS